MHACHWPPRKFRAGTQPPSTFHSMSACCQCHSSCLPKLFTNAFVFVRDTAVKGSEHTACMTLSAPSELMTTLWTLAASQGCANGHTMYGGCQARPCASIILSNARVQQAPPQFTSWKTTKNVAQAAQSRAHAQAPAGCKSAGVLAIRLFKRSAGTLRSRRRPAACPAAPCLPRLRRRARACRARQGPARVRMSCTHLPARAPRARRPAPG